MILYHGTNVEFEFIELSRSKPNKDFGRGFYMLDHYAEGGWFSNSWIASN